VSEHVDRPARGPRDGVHHGGDVRGLALDAVDIGSSSPDGRTRSIIVRTSSVASGGTGPEKKPGR
jgi:hypothetical protein